MIADNKQATRSFSHGKLGYSKIETNWDANNIEPVYFARIGLGNSTVSAIIDTATELTAIFEDQFINATIVDPQDFTVPYGVFEYTGNIAEDTICLGAGGCLEDFVYMYL